MENKNKDILFNAISKTREISSVLISAGYSIDSDLYRHIMAILENEDHVITNFDKKDTNLFKEAIEISGIKELYISQDAYWLNGHKDPKLSALKCTCEMDLTKFWDVFESINKGIYKEV
jgi:hypothetical protein